MTTETTTTTTTTSTTTTLEPEILKELEEITKENANYKPCGSKFGCCEDLLNPAKGTNLEGCPSM